MDFYYNSYSESGDEIASALEPLQSWLCAGCSDWVVVHSNSTWLCALDISHVM